MRKENYTRLWNDYHRRKTRWCAWSRSLSCTVSFKKAHRRSFKKLLHANLSSACCSRSGNKIEPVRSLNDSSPLSYKFPADLSILVVKYLHMILQKITFSENYTSYEGNLSLDYYIKSLREQNKKLKIGGSASPIRRSALGELLNLWESVLGVLQHLLDAHFDLNTSESIHSCLLPLLNETYSLYLVAQYSLKKLQGTWFVSDNFGWQHL